MNSACSCNRLRPAVYDLLIISIDGGVHFRQQTLQTKRCGNAAWLYDGIGDLRLLAGRIANQCSGKPHNQGGALTGVKRDAVEPIYHSLKQRIGIHIAIVSGIDFTAELSPQQIDNSQLILPLGAGLTMAQMRVNHQVAPAWIEQFQHEIGYFVTRESRLHLQHDRTPRTSQFLLAFTCPDGTFNVAAIGARLFVHQRMEFVNDF